MIYFRKNVKCYIDGVPYFYDVDKPNIAEHDIVVYKALSCFEASEEEGGYQYISPFYNKFYGTERDICGKVLREGLGLSQTVWEYYVTDGLYSCNNKRDLPKDDSIPIVVFECVIPSGSEYYTNGYMYCSDTLKIIRKL